ncbi:MAG: adenylate/guanylate cyclase domain-containing protein [Myxococcota bacterium]
MRRMRTFDRVVLLTLAPLFAAWFALSTLSAIHGRLAEPSVYVAFPGHPGELPRVVEVQAALETALELVSTVGGIEVAGERRHLSLGVGVATGPAFVGNIRSVDRLIWSAIGSTTNLAARMQALTRTLDAAIVTGSATGSELDRPPAGFERRRGIAIAGLAETHDLYVLPLAGSKESP